MANQAAKKAKKAASDSGKYYTSILVAATIYIIVRLFCGFKSTSLFLILRFLLAIGAELALIPFIMDVEARKAAAGKNDDKTTGEFYWDIFAIVCFVQVASPIEWLVRGSEWCWCITLIVPAVGSCILGKMAFSYLGWSKPNEKNAEPEEVDDPKKKRKQEGKQKQKIRYRR